ncbi:MAG: hypothetical protein HXS52_02750 [Theionarchaea archaeon]|nr:hypothetical protein [Theionarchaea archaeon]
MPAIVTERIEFEEGLCVNLKNLYRLLPFISKGGILRFFIIEIVDNNNKLIKRFKPMRKLELEPENYFDMLEKIWVPRIAFPEKDVLDLNVARNYTISILVVDYNGEPVFPFEIKALDYSSERIAGTLSRIEERLISFVVKNDILDKAASYLFDSHSRLEENDVEGARTSLRNAVQILRDKFIKNIELKDLEENKEFLKNLRKLTSDLSRFLSYGGPHPGPAPRMTTEMIIEVVIDIMRYLARCLEKEMIDVGSRV